MQSTFVQSSQAVFRALLDFFPTLRTWSRMPAFIGWIFFSAGIYAATTSGAYTFFLLYHDVVPWAIFFFLLSAIAVRNACWRCILFAAAGFTLSTYAAGAEHTAFSPLPAQRTFHRASPDILSGTVVSIPLPAYGRYTFTVTCDSLTIGGAPAGLRGKKILCTSDSPPPARAVVLLRGAYRPPRSRLNPHAFDERSYMLSNGIWGRFNADTFEVSGVRLSMLRRACAAFRATVMGALSHVENDTRRGILQAAFLGERNDIDSSTKAVFRESGLYHLLAISGLHVAILTAAVFFLLSPLPIPRTAKIFCTLAAVWCYLFFVGFIPSLFRSVVMASVVLLSLPFQRRSRGLNALGLAGIVWLLISPHSIVTAGYQLSFAATAGIIMLYPALSRRLLPSSQAPQHVLLTRPVLSVFLVSLSAFAATAPVMQYHFGTLSFFGLAANLLAVGLMSITMNFFFAGILAQMFWQPLSLVAMRGAEGALWCIVKIAEAGNGVPLSNISLPVVPAEIVAAYVLFLAGIAAVHRDRFFVYLNWSLPAMFLLIPVILLVHDVFAPAHVVCFSTSDRMTAGVRFPNGKIWLLGEPFETQYIKTYRDATGPWLRRFLRPRIDAVVIPSVGENIVHNLGPLMERHTVRAVIGNDERPARPARDDFTSFLSETNTVLTGWTDRTVFIPSPRCSCFIEKRVCTNAVTGKPPRGGSPFFSLIYVSIYGHRIILRDGGGEADGERIIAGLDKDDIYFDGEKVVIAAGRNGGRKVIRVRGNKACEICIGKKSVRFND